MLGRRAEGMDVEKRSLATIKAVMKKIFVGARGAALSGRRCCCALLRHAALRCAAQPGSVASTVTVPSSRRPACACLPTARALPPPRSPGPAALPGHCAPRRQAGEHPGDGRRAGEGDLGCGGWKLVWSGKVVSQRCWVRSRGPQHPPHPHTHTHTHTQVKLIDFGAACDLCTGINFNPEYGMLDPRYAGGWWSAL